MNMATTACLLVLVIVAGVLSQAPYDYKYDCRQPNTGCSADTNDCGQATGDCTCTAQEGFNCALNSTSVDGTCGADACDFGGTCLTGGGCFCLSNTYGPKCTYPRLNVWCTQDEMFINVYPFGDDSFNGKVYVSSNGISDTACPLTAVASTAPVTVDFPQVVDVHNLEAVTNMKGYWRSLAFAPDPAVSDPCGAAATEDVKDANDAVIGKMYTHDVTLEYNANMMTGIDQKITFKCIINTQADSFDSDISMDVSMVKGENYNPLEVVTDLDPVVMTITDSTGGVITNVLLLGDDFDIRLHKNDDTTIFKVTTCTAKNTLTAADTNPDGTPVTPYDLQFIVDGCPTVTSNQIFRAYPGKNDEGVYIAPLQAFRFRGLSDTVYFTCEIKLCDTANSAECDQPVCDPTPEASTDPDATNPPATNPPVTNPPATNPPVAPGGKRKRRAAGEENRKLTGQIQVAGNNGPSTTPTDDLSADKELEDCLQHSEVVVIIAIFSSVLALMIVVVIVLVVCLLRPRPKVVDASAESSVTGDTLNRYSLPRLSLATTM